jgi:hypothetical protein
LSRRVSQIARDDRSPISTGSSPNTVRNIQVNIGDIDQSIGVAADA